MQVAQLYVLSKDQELVSFLPIMLTKVEVKVEVCNDIKSLFSLCEKAVPNALLVDDDHFSQKEIFSLLKEYLGYYKRNITNIVLITEQTDTKVRVNYTLSGVDYFLSRPVNMMEIVARISALVQYQKRLRMIMSYERNAIAIDTMENILDYLEHRIKNPIQRFINDDMQDANLVKLRKYMRLVRKGAGEVMAAINAMRDEVGKLMASHGSIKNPSEELDELFKKNLAIITAAYHLDEEQEKTQEKK